MPVTVKRGKEGLEGQGLVEYALLLLLVAAVVIAILVVAAPSTPGSAAGGFRGSTPLPAGYNPTEKVTGRTTESAPSQTPTLVRVLPDPSQCPSVKQQLC